ncbi:NAD-dependent epimerase/dehydratase family protein [Anaeromyxobacter sp. Red801]|uniref:NAD-dependent epimerase/dehydratase family protein n=1 Tax=Anaeromyxobacter sp. Red801 TaxID=3411632 RepID=UPI003BA04431
MRVALTGATGFLGRAVAAALVARGHEVRALVRPGREAALPPAAGLVPVPGMLGDAAAAGALVAGADALLHLAALGVQSRDRDWARMVEANVAAPLALLDAAAAAGVGRVVAAGTCLEYRGHGRLPGAPAAGAPTCGEDAPLESADGYGATKAAGGVVLRARARARGLPLRWLRLASMYGPGDDPGKLVPGALRAARAGSPYEMTAGEQVREWLHRDDAVDAVVRAVEQGGDGAGAADVVDIVNVGTGEGVRLLDLVRAVYRAAGADPARVLAGARPYREGEVHRLVMDVSRAGAALGGWAPRVALADGLAALAAAEETG